MRALLTDGSGLTARDRQVPVQEAVEGPSAMGGARHKRSIDLPDARAGVETLGDELGRHSALSADVIVTDWAPRSSGGAAAVSWPSSSQDAGDAERT